MEYTFNMKEIISTNESAAERDLNEREILNKFEDILKGRDFEDLGQVGDEQGLCSWDIKTTFVTYSYFETFCIK